MYESESLPSLPTVLSVEVKEEKQNNAWSQAVHGWNPD